MPHIHIERFFTETRKETHQTGKEQGKTFTRHKDKTIKQQKNHFQQPDRDCIKSNGLLSVVTESHGTT